MRPALAPLAILALLVSGCGAKEDAAEAKSAQPTGPCKRLWIAHTDAQALVLGTYASSTRAPPPITTASAEVRLGRTIVADDSLDRDGCVRLQLRREEGDYAFHAKSQDASGCRWSAARSIHFDGTGFVEFEMKLATTCT